MEKGEIFQRSDPIKSHKNKHTKHVNTKDEIKRKFYL